MIIENTKNKYKEFGYEKDKFKVFEAHDVDPILHWNYLDKKDGKKYFMPDTHKEFMHVARIPTITYARWMKEYPELSADPETANKFLLKLLDKPENQVFKTILGRTS